MITVCEALQNRAQHNGKTVVIVGRFGSTMEGSWLSRECEHPIYAEGHAWSNSISTAYILPTEPPSPAIPVGFRWNDKRLRAKLEEVRATTVLQVLPKYHYRDKWVAMLGRFETRLLPDALHPDFGTQIELGYGHLNAAPARLVHPEQGFHPLTGK